MTRARRHDHDAGGSAELLARKSALRERLWRLVDRPGVRRFPGPVGRIPNFVGAERAAERLAGTDAWRGARTLKANPDAPQWPVRARALEDGKLVYMAVPRLADVQPFFLLDPEALLDSPRRASSIRGASRSARTVDVAELTAVDLVVTGSVAAGLDGARLGKGGGFSDLELAIATEAGLIGPATRIATTVHELQVLAAGEIPTGDHDVRLDLIVTPERVIQISHRGRRAPARIRWDELTDEKRRSIPVLERLAATRGAAGRSP